MDEPVASARTHLMCRRPWWGIAGFVVCVYFAHSSFGSLHSGDFEWTSGWGMVLTWAVWVVFAAGLISEGRCWRERIFFFTVLLALLIGLVFSAWTSARPAAVRQAREASLVLWSLAAFASLATIRSSKAHE